MRAPSLLTALLLSCAICCAPALAQTTVTTTPTTAVTAAIPRNFPPQYLLDANGKPGGFAIELMERLAQGAGLQVSYLVEDSWEGVSAAVREGRAQLIPNMGITAERAAYLDFTAPVETFNVALFVRETSKDVRGLNDLAGRRVGANRQSWAAGFLGRRDDMIPAMFASTEECLARLLSGDVDAVVSPQPVFMALARRARVEGLIKVAGPPLSEIKRAVAVRHDQPELLARLNRAVEEFVGGPEYQEMVTRWYGSPLPFWTPARVALAMGILLAAGLLGVLFWRHRSVVAANRALAASEERYRRIVETANEGIWMVDAQRRTTFVNPTMAATLGYAPEEMRGRPLDDFVLPEDMEEHRLSMARRRRGENEEYEIRRQGKDGRAVWFQVRATPIFDPQGGFLGSFAMYTDISQRKADQESLRLALAESQARAREMAALLEGARAVMAHQEFGPVARKVFDICRGLLGATAGYVALLDEEGEQNEVLFLEAGQRPCTVNPDLPMPVRGMRAETYREGRVVYDNDFPASPWVKHMPPGHVALDNVLFAPLNVEGRTVGVIGLANKPGGFTDDDARLAEVFGEIAAVGLRNGRLLMNLEASESRFRNLYQNMSAGVAVYEAVPGSQDFILRDLNQAGEVICRVRREDVLDRPVSQAFPGVKALGLFAVFQQVFADGKPRIHATGQYQDDRLAMWVENFVYKLPSGEVVAIFDDVSARKQAEDGLRESEAAMRGLLDATTDAVFLLDRGLKVLTANETAAQRLGRLPSEVVGRSALELFPPEVAQARQTRIAQVAASGQAVRFEDQRQGRHYDNRIFPILDHEGQVHRFGLYSRDITDTVAAERERKRLESQLLQAQKMEAIGTLAGGIAHDFNNILGAIMGFTEMALDEPDPERTRDLGEVLKAAERARDLVKQILTFSRRVEVELKPLDLNKEVARVAILLDRTLPKMVAVETHLSPDLPPVRANPNQIEQVILNLASNAADAMPAGGRLALETSDIVLDEVYCRVHVGAQPGRYVLLSVSDTGQGMDRHTREHIFDPFFTTKAVGQGTGLGLATVYGIIKGHGGSIWCYSEPGLGATFKIYLPAFAQHDATRRLQDPAATPQALPRGDETILLVDDEATLRALGARALTRQGYSVLSASSGEEALDIYKQRGQNLDLVILDLGMPGMGGHQCLLHILSLNPQAKVIIASGYAANGRVKDSLIAGALGFVAKPFRRAELALTVRAVLDGKEKK